jgi:hypothetical protein
MPGDLLNGTFEVVGAWVCWLNVRQLWRDKRLSGVKWEVQGFFVAWGCWNLWYYPSLGQWWSFVGGLLMVVMNGIWVGMAVWYAGVLGRWWDGVLEWCWFALGGDAWKRGGAETRRGGDAETGARLLEKPSTLERRQVCLFVGGPLDGEKISMPGYHVYEGHLIEVTCPGRESEYRMETWGVFEFVEGVKATADDGEGSDDL